MQFSILSFSRSDHKSTATWFLSLGYGEPSALLVKPKKNIPYPFSGSMYQIPNSFLSKKKKKKEFLGQ